MRCVMVFVGKFLHKKDHKKCLLFTGDTDGYYTVSPIFFLKESNLFKEYDFLVLFLAGFNLC